MTLLEIMTFVSCKNVLSLKSSANFIKSVFLMKDNLTISCQETEVKGYLYCKMINTVLKM